MNKCKTCGKEIDDREYNARDGQCQGCWAQIDNILVTVIITTYNRPCLLSRAIQSVVDQTYKNLEILVIDGYVSEQTIEIIKSFHDKRIKYIPDKDDENSLMRYGQVQRCRNLGVALSTGEYVAMLDDDDAWTKDKILIQLRLAKLMNAALVLSYMKIYSGKSMTIDKPILFPNYKDLLRSFNLSHTSSFFLDKEKLLKCGGFNESLKNMHEYDVALRMAKMGMVIATAPEPLLIAWCDNTQERTFYYTKISEVFDMYRLYGHDMLPYLGIKGFIFNIVKSALLITLFLLGYVWKEKVWDIIFPLKEMYQNKTRCA